MQESRTGTPIASLVVATVLLAGVLLLAYGYFQHNHAVLIAGLVVTGAGVLNGVVRLVARGRM